MTRCLMRAPLYYLTFAEYGPLILQFYEVSLGFQSLDVTDMTLDFTKILV